MAVGKTKTQRKGKGGKRKKISDCMIRKEWYDVLAPAGFEVRACAKTCVNKTAGMKRSEDSLKGRVFEVNLADLNPQEQGMGYRKLKLRVDHIVDRACLTNFHAMSITTDKLRSMVKKWCSLIEATVVVQTSDGYLLRVSLIGFTDRRKGQSKKNCYAQSTRIRYIRKKMAEITKSKLSKVELQTALKNFLNESPSKDIEKAFKNIKPLRDVHVRKVKIIRMPKFDVAKLVDAHGYKDDWVGLEPTAEAVGAAVNA